MNKILIGILAILGLGVAGTGLYFADGTSVTDPEIVQICEYVQQCKICVTNTIEMKDAGIKLDVDGTITLDGEPFTKAQILNLKQLEIK